MGLAPPNKENRGHLNFIKRRLKKSAGPILATSMLGFLAYLLTSLAIVLRPNADDYSALGRAKLSCDLWMDFAGKNGENSIGFLLVARVTFCSGASEHLLNFQMMNITRFTIMLVVSYFISRQLFRTKSVMNQISIGILLLLLLNTVVSGSENAIRQYLGINWTMQWIQHGLVFWLNVAILLELTKHKISNTGFKALGVGIVFCSTYSLLNLVFVFPLVITFYIRYFMKYATTDLRKYCGFGLALLNILLVIHNLVTASRGQRALDAQIDELSASRFLGLLILSIRENLIVNFWPIAMCIILGWIYKEKFAFLNSLNLRYIYLYSLWVSIILFIVEYFTYYAIWHHTTLLILILIVSLIIGTKLRKQTPILERKKTSIVISIIFLFSTQLGFAYNLLNEYQVNWDQQNSITNREFKAETLNLPLHLGIRDDDPYWRYFQEEIEIENRLSTPRVRFPDLEIDTFTMLPLNFYDSLIRLCLSGRPDSHRIEQWLL